MMKVEREALTDALARVANAAVGGSDPASVPTEPDPKLLLCGTTQEACLPQGKDRWGSLVYGRGRGMSAVPRWEQSQRMFASHGTTGNGSHSPLGRPARHRHSASEGDTAVSTLVSVVAELQQCSLNEPEAAEPKPSNLIEVSSFDIRHHELLRELLLTTENLQFVQDENGYHVATLRMMAPPTQTQSPPSPPKPHEPLPRTPPRWREKKAPMTDQYRRSLTSPDSMACVVGETEGTSTLSQTWPRRGTMHPDVDQAAAPSEREEWEIEGESERERDPAGASEHYEERRSVLVRKIVNLKVGGGGVPDHMGEDHMGAKQHREWDTGGSGEGGGFLEGRGDVGRGLGSSHVRERYEEGEVVSGEKERRKHRAVSDPWQGGREARRLEDVGNKVRQSLGVGVGRLVATAVEAKYGPLIRRLGLGTAWEARIRPLPWVLRTAEEVFEARYTWEVLQLQAKAAKAAEPNTSAANSFQKANQQMAGERTSMGTFLWQFFLKRYGLRQLAEAALWEFLCNLENARNNAETFACITLLCSVLLGDYDDNDLVFLLYCRQVVLAELAKSLPSKVRVPRGSSRRVSVGRTPGGGRRKGSSLVDHGVASGDSLKSGTGLSVAVLTRQQCIGTTRMIFRSSASRPLFLEVGQEVEALFRAGRRRQNASGRYQRATSADTIQAYAYIAAVVGIYHNAHPATGHEERGESSQRRDTNEQSESGNVTPSGSTAGRGRDSSSKASQSSGDEESEPAFEPVLQSLSSESEKRHERGGIGEGGNVRREEQDLSKNDEVRGSDLSDVGVGMSEPMKSSHLAASGGTQVGEEHESTLWEEGSVVREGGEDEDEGRVVIGSGFHDFD